MTQAGVKFLGRSELTAKILGRLTPPQFAHYVNASGLDLSFGSDGGRLKLL